MASGGLSRLLKQRQQEDWLGPTLDAASRGMPERWDDPVLYVRPSAAGTSCPRAGQLTQLGHHNEETAGLTALFEAGKDLELRVQARYRAAGVLAGHNVRLWVYLDGDFSTGKFPRGDMSEVVWSGEADLLIWDQARGEVVFGEVKKMHPFRQRNFPKATSDPEANMTALFKAEPKYSVQLTQYIARHGRYLGASKTAFVHVEDEWGAYQILWVRPTAGHIALAFKVAGQAEEASARGILLEPSFTRMSKPCRSCDSERVCYDLQDGDPETCLKVETALQTTKDWTRERAVT